ncbi:MAG: SDR family oxidoreductase [Planctomycetota bacterium]|nr:SDR family oxidoreductase [Planctomycetota bacterium]
MDLGIQGKAAAVAASSSGLGFAVARELAREGARVMICSRRPERVEEAVAEIRQSAGNDAGQVEGIVLDFSDVGAPERFVRETAVAFGAVDILVANNGGPPPGPPLGLGDEAWEVGFRQTFESSRRLAEAAIPGMRSRGWGRIVFITSISVKQPIAGLAISTAMRSAVVGYAKMLSDDLACHGVTVNCVAPGSTATARLESLLAERARKEDRPLDEVRSAAEAQIPAARFGRPEEFAAAVAFFASDRASYISGTVLAVDGGLVRSLT